MCAACAADDDGTATRDEPALRARLKTIARASSGLMNQLAAARSLRLGSWCIAAGAIRNLVWDHLLGRAIGTPADDVDLAYFDAEDISAERDETLRLRLAAQTPGIPWEVVNQAGVHQWYEARFGFPVPPLVSLEQALASWPECATAVGLWLDDDDQLRVIAPFGLRDLFAMVVRHNPARASVGAFRERVRAKRFEQRWPGVRVLDG